jgi:hypothetical protein
LFLNVPEHMAELYSTYLADALKEEIHVRHGISPLQTITEEFVRDIAVPRDVEPPSYLQVLRPAFRISPQFRQILNEQLKNKLLSEDGPLAIVRPTTNGQQLTEVERTKLSNDIANSMVPWTLSASLDTLRVEIKQLRKDLTKIRKLLDSKKRDSLDV